MEKKYLDKDGLIFFWTKLKSMFASKEQGDKADGAVQSVKVGESGTELNINGAAVLPEYPVIPTDNVTGVKMGDTTVNGVLGVADITTPVNNAILEAVGDITGMEFVKLNEGEFDPDTGIPTVSGETNKIYLTPNGGEASNGYDEWIWISSDNTFEKIGTTDIDLSGYLLAKDLTPITNAEIDAIVNT